jgi:hypothetical protein
MKTNSKHRTCSSQMIQRLFFFVRYRESAWLNKFGESLFSFRAKQRKYKQSMTTNELQVQTISREH